MSNTLQDDYKVYVDTEEFEGNEEEMLSEPPHYGGDGWEEYVMSLFHDDEVIEDGQNKLILCRGLRRVANLVLGDVVYSRPTQVFLSNDNNGPGKATVVYEISFNWMDTGEFRTFGDVAETWYGNTDPVFAGHPAATACTKAEGRVFRKALMINCLSFEEMPHNVDVGAAVKQSIPATVTDGEITHDEKITDKQLNFMTKKCEQLNIDVDRYVCIVSDKKYNHPEQVSKKDAIDMIRKLTEYQNGEVKIPEEILS